MFRDARLPHVDFMNGNCGMDDLWLNGFLVNDRLDVLVNCQRTCQKMEGAGTKF